MEAYIELEQHLQKLNAERRELEKIIRESTDEGEIGEARIKKRSINRLSKSICQQMKEIDPIRYEAGHAHPHKNSHHMEKAFFFDGCSQGRSLFAEENLSENEEILTEEIKADMQLYFSLCSPFRNAIFDAVYNRGMTIRQVKRLLGYTSNSGTISKSLSRIKNNLRRWIKERQLLRECAAGENFNWKRFFDESACFTPKQKYVGTYLCTHEVKVAKELFNLPQYSFNNYTILRNTISDIKLKLRILGAAGYVKQSCILWPVNLRMWGELDKPVLEEFNVLDIEHMLGRMLAGHGGYGGEP